MRTGITAALPAVRSDWRYPPVTESRRRRLLPGVRRWPAPLNHRGFVDGRTPSDY